MTNTVTLQEVHRRFELRAETIHAVNGVSMDLEAGAIVGLVGPSGSGKTTLLELIVGWQRPDSGLVHIEPSERRGWNHVAIVPQDLGLIEDLDLIENIELPARLGNLQKMATSDAIEALGLQGLERRTPQEMSLGEQQRAVVARALVAAAVVLIADEPTSHLDEANARRVIDLLVEAARSGSAVLVATHDERAIERFDRVIDMQDGSAAPRGNAR